MIDLLLSKNITQAGGARRSYTMNVCAWLYQRSLTVKGGNDSAGGSKGPARPLGGVRGVPAFLPHPAARGGARAKEPEELPNLLIIRNVYIVFFVMSSV